MTDLDRAERELRAVLAARADDIPPADLHDGALRRARRHRIAVVAASATAVALVAAGVPTALAATRDEAAPRPPATAPEPPIPAVLPVPDLFDCPALHEPGKGSPGAPVDDPGLPEQRDVAGSLGDRPGAVNAIAQAGWGAISAYKPELDARRTRVVAAHRADDGWIVGLVTGGNASRSVSMTVPVVGPDLGHLVGLADGWTEWGSDREPLDARFGSGDLYAGVIGKCGPVRVLVGGPGGATSSVVWTQDVRADGTVDKRTQQIELRPDGVAVVSPAAPPTVAFRVRVARGDVLFAEDRYVGPDVPPLPTDAVVLAALRAAPGNAPEQPPLPALILGSHAFLPVPQRDVRVLWAGKAGSVVAAARVSTLPSGAQYLVDGRSAATTLGRRTATGT